MKRITTVTGDIAPEELGFTTMHEHTICDMRIMTDLPYMQEYLEMIPPESLVLKKENLAMLRMGTGIYSEECRTLGDVDYMVGELEAFKAVGGETVVDASPIGARGSVLEMKEASERSGVNIVCATGIYFAAARPKEFIDATVAFQYDCFKDEIENGIDGTDVHPGFLKCAINTLDDVGNVVKAELDSVRACAQLAKETGLSLHIHAGLPCAMDHVISTADIALEECALSPDRLLMLHTDQYIRNPQDIGEYITDFNVSRNVELKSHLTLLDKGVNIGFDSINTQVIHLPDNTDRIKALLYLTGKGYASQIVLGHDIFNKAAGIQWGGWGFGGFMNTIIPSLFEYGMDPSNLTVMGTENPARILAY